MCQKFWLSGLVHSLFCQYYCILFKTRSCQLLALLPVILMQSGARLKALDALTFDFSATTTQGSLFRSNPTDGSDLIVSPRARMPENLCRFGFSRFLGFPSQLEGFRANSSTTRLPPPLASTSTLGPKLASRVALTANVRPAPWRFRLSDFNREVERSEL